VTTVQDAIAIAVSIAAGVWLVRTLLRQVVAPSCGTRADPTAPDGFVPLDALTAAARKPARPAGTPADSARDGHSP
jgi:hypothetical protein